MQWEWDPQKDRQNQQKHGIDFESASRVFNDPFQVRSVDPHPEEERFRTLGMANRTVMVVIHTMPSHYPETGDAVGRIISARKATRNERRMYDFGIFLAYRGADSAAQGP